MWSSILNSLGDKIPKFNDYLLSGFRKEKINEIPKYLDGLYQQSMKTVESKFGAAAAVFKYIGYTELTPEERLEYLKNEVKYNRTFDIRETNVRTMRYAFTFKDEVCHMYIDLPLMDNHAVTINSVNFYPMFAVVEVGGMVLDRECITLRVMRANLRFFRSSRCRVTIKTMDGRMVKANNLTCKIHLKSKNHPPIVLYHLAKYGFTETMKAYGLGGKISLTDIYDEKDKKHIYVRVNESSFLKVNNSAFDKQRMQQVIASLTTIYKVHRRFDAAKAEIPYYYKVVLGKLTFPSAPNNVLRAKNADDHLAMNESMLDEPSLANFRSIGLNISTMDQLLLCMFDNIDDYLASSRLNDLYNKKLASLDKLVSDLIQRFNVKLFSLIINNKPGLTLESVKKLMFSAGQQCRWLIGSQLFRSMPTIINDNALLTITGRRFRAFGNIEMSGNAKRNKVSMDHLRSHPSSMIVESIQTVPTSGISNGSINPYLIIDKDGKFIVDDELKKMVEHVFDT